MKIFQSTFSIKNLQRRDATFESLLKTLPVFFFTILKLKKIQYLATYDFFSRRDETLKGEKNFTIQFFPRINNEKSSLVNRNSFFSREMYLFISMKDN